jgi:hypothetical protein
MPPMEVIPWDGKDYGSDWEDLAAAYFHAAGLLRGDETYDPNEQGVPQELFDAWAEHDGYFVAAVYAWLNEHRDDPRLGGDVDLKDAPWIIEWARANYLGRWDTKYQWGQMVLADELRDSDWGVTWEHYVDWDKAVDEADVEFIEFAGDVFVYDDRIGDAPAAYRNDWLAARKIAVGEIVMLQVFENPAEQGVMRIPGKVRGKWEHDAVAVRTFLVAVELMERLGNYAPGDVAVFNHNVVRRQPHGQPWRAMTIEEMMELPTVRVVHRRAVAVPEGSNG